MRYTAGKCTNLLTECIRSLKCTRLEMRMDTPGKLTNLLTECIQSLKCTQLEMRMDISTIKKTICGNGFKFEDRTLHGGRTIRYI